MMKLRKLVICATVVEIQNRKYYHEARDGNFHYIHLHVNFDGQK